MARRHGNPTPKENREAEDLDAKVMGLTTGLDLNLDHTWERFTTIHQNDYTCFDNVDKIPAQIFDEFCTTVTGYDFKKREHHKMTKMQTLKGRRAIALTSTGVPTTRSDLMDRVFHTELAALKNNKSDQQVYSEFYRDKAKILGFIFTKMKQFLEDYDKLKHEIKPKTRMADFEVQREIMARIIGMKEFQFQNAWVKKREAQVEVTLEGDALSEGFFNYLKEVRNEIIDKFKDDLKSGSIKESDIQFKAKDETANILSIIESNTIWRKQYLSQDDKKAGGVIPRLVDMH